MSFNTMLIAIFGAISAMAVLKAQQIWAETKAIRREQATKAEQQNIKQALEAVANGQLHRTSDARTRSTDELPATGGDDDKGDK